jgi:hypothetical protein
MKEKSSFAGSIYFVNLNPVKGGEKNEDHKINTHINNRISYHGF